MMEPDSENKETVDFDRVLKLLEIVYEPGHDPWQIEDAQKQLQEVQRSPQGWSYAEKLLGMPATYARFYGALILKMKIVSDWVSVGDEEEALLSRLITWFISEVNYHKGRIVIRKLCSALTAFFTQSTMMTRGVATLALSLVHHQALFKEAELTTPVHMTQLNEHQVQALLWFATSLAEEGSSLKDVESTGLFSEYHPSIVLIESVLQLPNPSFNSKLYRESGRCFLAWCEHVHTVEPRDSSSKDALRSVVPAIIERLDPRDTESEFPDLMGDILERFPNLLRDKDLDRLAQILASHSHRWLDSNEVWDEDDELATFANLLLRFADVGMKNLVKGQDQSYDSLVKFLATILIRGDETEAPTTWLTRILEFWISYTECVQNVVDEGEDADDSPFVEIARQRILDVIWAGWSRICWPDDDSMNGWDSEEISRLAIFRTDYQELIQTGYLLFGTPLMDHFATKAVLFVSQTQWLRVEACVYVINALSDTSAPQESATELVLSRLFSSELFNCNLTTSPVKLERAKLRTVTHYSTYFKNNPENLLTLLEWLFEALGSPSLDSLAAQAIFSIGSSCRGELIPMLGSFIERFNPLLFGIPASLAVVEPLVSAISSIIQATSPESEKFEPLATIVGALDVKFQAAVRIVTDSYSQAGSAALLAVRCVAAIGRALKAPDEAIIENDNADHKLTYWNSAEGDSLRNTILRILFGALEHFADNSEIIEAACWALREGYGESQPGLFLFAPEVMADFVEAVNLETARPEYILENAGHMLVKQEGENGPQKQEVAYRILIRAKRLLEIQSSESLEDPGFNASVLDLMAKMIPRYLESLMMIPRDGVDLLELAVLGVKASEPPLKQASAHFWASFLQNYQLNDELQSIFDSAVLALGPLVCNELIFQIGGDAERSQLDSLAEPLKKVIFHRPLAAKGWIASALNDTRFPSSRVGEQEKRIWLQKLLNLRGARATNVVIKEFWVQCRGTELKYACTRGHHVTKR